MLRASVLIPTREHAATLPLAVKSVQLQSIKEIEILIVGDGVDDRLRTIIERLRADDSRIKFFDFPKGPRHGEIHRDAVLRQARGRIVCYQCDDDLSLAGHLQDMEAALEDADFAGSMHADVSPDGWIRGYVFNFHQPEFREPWFAWTPNRLGPWASDGFGLGFGAHRLDTYLRLSEGWATTPDGYPTDQTMWMKFVREPWCRTKVLPWPVSLHFPKTERQGWTDRQRADELSRWMDLLASPDATQHVLREILRSFSDMLLQQVAREAVKAKRDGPMIDALTKERDALAAARDAAQIKHEKMLSSTSWRLTAPMRAAIDMVRRFKARQDA
jgi:glycosyltransferase involved in cell wall biosynthesis